MDIQSLVFGIVFLAFVVFLIIRGSREAPNPIKDAVLRMPGGPSLLWDRSADNRQAIALSQDDRSILHFSLTGNTVTCRTIPFQHLISAEIYEDGDTIMSSARGRTVGGAIVGGLLAGGAGAVVGGLSGKKRSAATVRNIDLRITVNDTRAPTITIPFMPCEVERTHPIYAESSKPARDWHGRLSILIKRAERETDHADTPPITSQQFSPVIRVKAAKAPKPPTRAEVIRERIVQARSLISEEKSTKPGEHRLEP
jgi:hypothetical protein